MDIAGSSFENGIELSIYSLSVKSYYNEKDEIITEVTTSMVDQIKAVEKSKSWPFIRHTLLFLLKIPLINGLLRGWNARDTSNLLLVIWLDVYFKLTAHIHELKIQGIEFMDTGYYILILLGISALCYFVRQALFFRKANRLNKGSLARFHAAEHKVINVYESNKEITLENIKVASRVNPQCGNVFDYYFKFFLGVFEVTLYFFVPSLTLWYILALAVSYELFFIENPSEHWYSKHFYELGLREQELNSTSEPTEYELRLAEECIKTFSAKYNELYK